MELDKKIQSKRHEELLKALSRVTSSVSELKDSGDGDKALISSIEKQTNTIQLFLDEFKRVESKEKQPNNDEKIITLFDTIATKITEQLNGLKEAISNKEEKPEWVHKITKRDYHGRVSEIISTPKTKQ